MVCIESRGIAYRSRYRRDGCELRLLLVRGTEASSTANCSCSAPWQWTVCRVNWRPCYRRRGPKPLTAGGRGRRRKIASSWVESERPNRQGPRRSSAKSSSAARRWMGFDICRQSWLAPWISQFSWLFQETLHAAAMTPGDVEVNGGGARHWPRRSQCLPVLGWSTAPSRVAEISRYAGTGLSYLTFLSQVPAAFLSHLVLGSREERRLLKTNESFPLRDMFHLVDLRYADISPGDSSTTPFAESDIKRRAHIVYAVCHHAEQTDEFMYVGGTHCVPCVGLTRTCRREALRSIEPSDARVEPFAFDRHRNQYYHFGATVAATVTTMLTCTVGNDDGRVYRQAAPTKNEPDGRFELVCDGYDSCRGRC